MSDEYRMWSHEEIRAQHQHQEDTARAIFEAEQAVIEAAKDAEQTIRWLLQDSMPDHYMPAKLERLCRTLRALQEVEGGG